MSPKKSTPPRAAPAPYREEFSTPPNIAVTPEVRAEAETYGHRIEYWIRMSPLDRELHALVRPLRRTVYQVNTHVSQLERQLGDIADTARAQGGVFDLNPDFQRGHVWDLKRQIAFIEAFLRGVAPATFRFNCPDYGERSRTGDLPEHDFLCIDGLQRITAILAFLRGEFAIFGDKTLEALKASSFDLTRPNYAVEFLVYDLRTRRDLLQFYRDLNAGGIAHTDKEIARIDALIASAP